MTDASPVSALATLIADVQTRFLDTHGVPLSYGDIARRSGGRLTRGRVQQLATEKVKSMPAPATLTGLALGLQVMESDVLLRAMEDAGYPVSPDMQMAARKAPDRRSK